MLDGKRVLVVVPARGGSKGVPLKNLRPVLGVPLVARVGHLVQQISFIDRAVISTDNPEIACVAREAGLDAPFVRPDELSGDRVSDYEVLVNALREVEQHDGSTYNVVVMLQPTSPLRTAGHVRDTVVKLLREHRDAVWTVSRTDPRYHPLKQLRIRNNQIDYYDRQGDQVIARQDLEPLFHKNGAAYAMTRECLLDYKSIKGRNTGALIIDEDMISIDTLEDFEQVERLIRRGSHQGEP